MSEKYYIEQGTEQDHFFIEHEWHVICTVNTQLECICLGKGEAELICRLLNEEEKRKSLPRISKGLKEIQLLGLTKIIAGKKKDDPKVKDLTNLFKIIESLECE